MIKYSYALADQKYIININDISPETRKTHIYYCLGCGKELIPRLGEVRLKHFAHKVQQENDSCSGETYLHYTAKILLYNSIRAKIKNKKPLYLQYMGENCCASCHYPEEEYRNCTISQTSRKIDLLSQFDEIHLEKRTDKFIPDLLLTNKNHERVFIEIAVTHKASDTKTNSGNKMIEIIIKEEKDLIYLTGDQINPEQLEAHSINFKFPKKFISIKPEECPCGNNSLFFVYRNGKARLLSNLKNPESYPLKHKTWYYYRLIKGHGDGVETFISCLEAAYNEGVNVKNCYLCRYHGYKIVCGITTKGIFCKFLRRDIQNSNNAAECEYYRPDPSTFPSKHAHQ